MFAKFKRLTWKASLLATIVSLLVSTIVLAASGDLDTTFSGDGIVTSYIVPSNPNRIDRGYDVAIQSNGKIVTVGNSYISSTDKGGFAITRHNTNGTLDATFSGDGRLITNFGGNDQAYGVAIQTDGKIVVAGRTCTSNSNIRNCDVALARYTSGGGLDPTFSGDGKQTSDFGGDDNGAEALAIQSDGKIVASGYMWNGTDYDFAVYRYLSNGSLDTTFSGDGMAKISFASGQYDRSSNIAIQPDGKIIVAGYADKEGSGNFAVARLNANGSLDTAFSGDGRQTTDFGGNDYIGEIALQANGNIVAVGGKGIGSFSDVFALARYTNNGNLDTTFAGTGKKTFSISSGVSSWATDVIVQSDNKIVLLGTADVGGFQASDYVLVRLNKNEGLDTTFNGNGKTLIDFGDDDDASGLAIQGGKYVLVGTTGNGVQADFALARVLP